MPHRARRMGWWLGGFGSLPPLLLLLYGPPGHLWLVSSQQVSTVGAQDRYVFVTGATTCEDAGHATILDAEQCLEASVEERRRPLGWGGKVHVGYTADYACGCLYLESLGNVELWQPPGCSRQKSCNDLDGCFCRRVSPGAAAAAPESGARTASGEAVLAHPGVDTAPLLRPHAPAPDEKGDLMAEFGVNCGGHIAARCEDCTQGHGVVWCNGDCKWFTPGGCLDPNEASTTLSHQERERTAASAVEDAIKELMGSFGGFDGAEGIGGAKRGERSSGRDGSSSSNAGLGGGENAAGSVLPDGALSKLASGEQSTQTLTTTAAPRDPFKCPGSIPVRGYGDVELVNAKWNVPGERAAHVAVVQNRSVVPQLKGRSYFADACRTGKYNNQQYVAWKLLGKTLTYTTDLSGAGCGCNGALYMTSLQQSESASKCYDHYCDANSVCGEACAEIDIQEANARAWHSTLHVFNDGGGIGGGFGGGANGWSAPRDWSKADYQPKSSCIDTDKPFQVAVSFPVDEHGTLQAMSVVLSQAGRECTVATCVKDYNFAGRNGMSELTKALAKGMTPIISYWSSDILIGMDGKGPDGQGACAEDHPDQCGETVKFYDFGIADIALGHPTCEAKCSGIADDCSSTKCCNVAGRQCFEKDSSWASCKESCNPGIDKNEPEGQQSPWTCKLLSSSPIKRPQHPLASPDGPSGESPGGSASMCSKIGDNCKDTGCCSNPDRDCYEKDKMFASCLVKCKPGIDLSEPMDVQTPWSCRKLSSSAQDYIVQRDASWSDSPDDQEASTYKDSSYERVSEFARSFPSGSWRPPRAVLAIAGIGTMASLLVSLAAGTRAFRRQGREGQLRNRQCFFRRSSAALEVSGEGRLGGSIDGYKSLDAAVNGYDSAIPEVA